MRKYKEIRVLHWDDLRKLCINKHWYTAGNSTAYENMLAKCEKDNITTDDIVEIAQDIMEHTTGEERELEGFCFEIAKVCNTFFE